MAAKKKLQVFVSSTYRDLKLERQAAVEAILKASHIPAGMELFSAGSDSQLETIRRWIDESDIYMLILGGRYGSIDPNTSLSYTELEYDYALAQGKPVFAVVIKDTALDEKVRKDGKDVLESEFPKELKLFQAKVLGKISSFFSDPKDIKLAVHETLADFQARYEFTGWVSGEEAVDVAPLLDEISKLRKERDELSKQLAKATDTATPIAKVGGKWTDEDLRETALAIKRLEIKTAVLGGSETESKTFTVDVLLDVMRDTLITGVTNRAVVDKVEKLLFFNVCPKLEMHELAALEKVPGMQWKRYRLTPKGKALLVFIDKAKQRAQAQLSAPNAAIVKPSADATLSTVDTP